MANQKSTKISSASRLKTAKSLLNKLTKTKTIPAVAARLVNMIEDDNNSLQDFEEVIKVDPTLVLRILRLVNSSYYALRTKIKNVSEAVAYIGIDNLRNLIVIDALKHLFSGNKDSEYFPRNRLWMHCAAVSICCQMISERIFEEKGEDAFLCGILHDIGLIVEDQIQPDKFKKFCQTFNPDTTLITDHESSIIGTDHTSVGYLLAKDWGLSNDIQDGIKMHHKNLDQISPNSIQGILQTAEYLVFRLHYTGFPEVKSILPQPLILHMKKSITSYRAIAQDLPSEIKKAEEIYALEKE